MQLVLSYLPPVTLPSEEQAPIISIKTSPLNLTFHLKDMLGVPSFKVNLMFVIRVTSGLTFP